ncbi:zinc finger protein 568-like isoform X2 [Sphaeramia orbicularis]|uniref:zinc finger protein 568-like isoform X2 n=1 Tax=Sphaeramia orbicularis TaxID=375764 RepID=UPI00117D5374|nr:zinc finger protein 568-like isoform X2 [Sphaeramia orbicularis]
MCSVVGCESWRRSVQRFKLPEDPEMRLEWVQFLLEVNGQRLKEESWTDITVCAEHFYTDCFEKYTKSGTVQLKPSAVPLVCVKSCKHLDLQVPPVVVNSESEDAHLDNPVPETVDAHLHSSVPDSVDAHLHSLQNGESVETAEVACQCDKTEMRRCLQSDPKSSNHTLADADTSRFEKIQEAISTELEKEKTPFLQIKGKYVVNENCLLQLFPRTCPSCDRTLKMEKIIEGMLVILIQTCLQCEYRNEWKSQVDPSITDQRRTRGKKKLRTDDNCSRTVISEMHTLSNKEHDLADEEEEGEEGGEGPGSDEEWKPEDILLAEKLKGESEEETEDESGIEEDSHLSTGGLNANQLCTECGRFYNILKHHICEHKIKPYSCNICGKRCVSEISLRNHSRVHDETYEHHCKYCYVTFKTKADKVAHEQIHQDKKDPYKCPDCSATFATNKERFRHLENHRSSKELKCDVCGIEFKDLHKLRRHSVVHTGLKPYKCLVCQRGFSQSNNLKSHMRQHTGERPYKCQHCDKCFAHNVSLKSHVQRYHGHQRNKEKINERSSDAGDAQDNCKRGVDSGVDKVVKEQHTEAEVNNERTGLPTNYKRRTGRPKGRPKRDTAEHSREEAKQGSSTY